VVANVDLVTLVQPYPASYLLLQYYVQVRSVRRRDLKTRRYLLLLSVWICLHSVLHSDLRKSEYRIKLCVTVVQGYSKSSKSVPIKSAYAICY